MMLRRTNANQVEKVYVELFDKFPDSYSISKADEKKIEEILTPLGLKWRIPSIISVTKIIQKEYSGIIPCTREELTKLPGIGEYVAGAVLSIAFNKREWIVDSNVVRVFKRFFAISTSKEGRRDKHIIEIAKVYSSCNSPRDANLAILDFAAKVCTSGNRPHCSICPLKDFCKSCL
jgi:A/G-specific adenine glycosylase